MSIKAIDEMTLDVLGLPFGEDEQGQVFDRSTNIELQPGQAIPVYYWHGFAEKASRAVKRIGKAIYDRVDEAGHWFKVYLDRTSDIARRIYQDAVAGKVRASSDSAAHLVRPAGIVGKPGRVTSWPIFALSLMDATTADTAVNKRAIAFAAAKALIEESSSEDGESIIAGEAAKAGAVFAKRNRERIAKIRALLDEMVAEFPPDDDSMTAATEAVLRNDYSPAAKANILALPREQIIALIDAQIAQMR